MSSTDSAGADNSYRPSRKLSCWLSGGANHPAQESTRRPQYRERIPALVVTPRPGALHQGVGPEVLADGGFESAGAVTMEDEPRGFPLRKQAVDEGVDAFEGLLD